MAGVTVGMIRPLIGIAGVLAALLPDRIINIFETTAIENADEQTSRSWNSSVIRTEGIAVAVVSLAGGRAYVWMMNLTGLCGAAIFLFPQLYRRFATWLLYENPDDVEWNDTFSDGVRLVGAAYVLLAVRAFTRRRTDD